jgi:two-component system, LytTR family, response regulator
MLRALLIDDEPSARDDLRDMLAAHAAVKVVGEAGLIPAARVLLGRDDYDLVFLDVQLRGGTGFDLVPHLRQSAAVVFVTGSERFAVRAFEVNALDYLVKPVAAERLAATLLRHLDVSTRPTAGSVPASAAPLRADDRVFLKNDRGAQFVAVAEVSAIVAHENYTDVLLANGTHFLIRRTMKVWEEMLPPELFVRVHRTTLVNLRHIEAIADPDGDTPQLRLRGVTTSIACSHRLSPELRRRVGK